MEIVTNRTTKTENRIYSSATNGPMRVAVSHSGEVVLGDFSVCEQELILSPQETVELAQNLLEAVTRLHVIEAVKGR